MTHTMYTVSPQTLSVEIKDALRYLSIKSPDEGTLALAIECIEEAKEIAVPKAVYVKSRVKIEGRRVIFDFMEMESENLVKFLDGYSEAYIFVATIGIRADMLVNRYLKSQPSKGVLFNASCVAVIESFCDRLNLFLTDGRYRERRYSPGYGDLSIEYQKELLKYLDAERKIGVTLTEGSLMVPTKTVSAIIGIPE
ncbi:MAG: hypothetical protein IJX51_00500 [Clostridia bacterium]|nr:hypothetical protein [Clostridia bacterium]